MRPWRAGRLPRRVGRHIRLLARCSPSQPSTSVGEEASSRAGATTGISTENRSVLGSIPSIATCAERGQINISAETGAAQGCGETSVRL